MVKHWVIILVISIVLIAGCVVESIYVNNAFDWLGDTLEAYELELDQNKENINTPELVYKAEQIHSTWHEKVKVLKCLIWHTGIKDVEVGLARISVYVNQNDYTEACAETEALIDYVKHYSDDFSITLENIL